MVERVDLSRREPELRGGAPVWPVAAAGVAGFFAGRGVPERDSAAIAALLPAGVAPAWLRQVHGARSRAAFPGSCGDGDALVVTRPGVAALIATADCVPVLIAAPGVALAIHAGWRGLVAGVVGAAVAELAEPRQASAWIGPAIGPCCYEVGPEVSERFDADLTRDRRLDLWTAAERLLRACGVARVDRVDLCTRCNPDLFFSHRRDGKPRGVQGVIGALA
jgi:hypothetical protein